MISKCECRGSVHSSNSEPCSKDADAAGCCRRAGPSTPVEGNAAAATAVAVPILVQPRRDTAYCLRHHHHHHQSRGRQQPRTGTHPLHTRTVIQFAGLLRDICE